MVNSTTLWCLINFTVSTWFIVIWTDICITMCIKYRRIWFMYILILMFNLLIIKLILLLVLLLHNNIMKEIKLRWRSYCWITNVIHGFIADLKSAITWMKKRKCTLTGEEIYREAKRGHLFLFTHINRIW